MARSMKALARHCMLMAALTAFLTACQSSAPPQPRSSGVQQAQAASAPAAKASQAASAPAPANRDYAVRWLRPLQNRDKDDGVEVIDRGWRGGVRLVITSGSGTGAAEVQPTHTAWPHQVQLQFQYAPDKPFDELETLSLQVIDSANRAGDQESDLQPAGGFAVWQRDGAMRVDLPAGWPQARQKLRIAWADRMRTLPEQPPPPETPPPEPQPPAATTLFPNQTATPAP